MSSVAWPRRLVRWASLGAATVTVHSLVNLRLLRTPDCVDWLSESDSHPTHSGVSVLVPARDEADHIGPCVRALLDQRGVSLELLVLDDESSDRTAALALDAADGDPRLRVLPGTAPPPGWLGKPHACRQ
ncbi:MAG: glycosyltransferase, partial [Actinomycetota bacterium]|nr:glycosyltransferase [Actinomycetota bacterium]